MESRHPKRPPNPGVGWRKRCRSLLRGCRLTAPREEAPAPPQKGATLPSTDQQRRRPWLAPLLIALPFLLWATQVWARRGIKVPDVTKGLESSPITLVVVLAGMALLPFLLMMITSFVKIAVVLSIIRSALGTQQNPPTQVITGLSIVLTVYVMVPVAMDVHTSIKPTLKKYQNTKSAVRMVPDLIKYGSAPVKEFLKRHSHQKERAMFYDLGIQLQKTQEMRRKLRYKKMRKKGLRARKAKKPKKLTYDDFLVLIPSFVISELKEAFQIGFLIFLPFLIVDMVVANILLALGMHMLSPTTISLPFKLLLFVLVDGWYLLAKGLVLGYL